MKGGRDCNHNNYKRRRKCNHTTTTITNGGRVCNHINCERREGVQSQEFVILTTQIYFRIGVYRLEEVETFPALKVFTS